MTMSKKMMMECAFNNVVHNEHANIITYLYEKEFSSENFKCCPDTDGDLDKPITMYLFVEDYETSRRIAEAILKYERADMFKWNISVVKNLEKDWLEDFRNKTTS